MSTIRTILCPVDLSPFSRREVELAVELARTFGARLVLHHNLPATGFGLAKSWEWKKAHPGADADRPAEEKMAELVKAIPDEVPYDTLISDGPLAIGVARLAEELPADLVLLGCHGCSGEEHASLTEDLLGRCGCPLLTIHEGEGRQWSLPLERERPLRILVPTDFSAAAEEAVRYAYRLADDLGAEIDLLHVVGSAKASMSPIDPVGPSVPFREAAEADAEARLADLVPEERRHRVRRHVMFGRADEAIVEKAEDLEPDLILMGEHAREFFRRFFTRDTARGVLHEATCPVWFVPPPMAA